MSRDVNERRPSALVGINPSDGSCGRVADTEISRNAARRAGRHGPAEVAKVAAALRGVVKFLAGMLVVAVAIALGRPSGSSISGSELQSHLAVQGLAESSR